MKKLTALGALMTLALVGCQIGTSDEVIKIGYIGPLTGDAASYGADTHNAVLMKVEEINAAGGIDGKMIELISEDGLCTGSNSASAAQKLIHIDGVVGIIGGQCSSETLAAAPIAEAAKVIMIAPISSSPDVTDAGDFIFRVYPNDALKGMVMSKYIEREGYKSVAIITENTDYAQGIRESLKKALPETIPVVFDETVEPGTKDFRALVSRMQDLDFDIFVLNPQSDSVLAAMAQQFRDQGLTQDMLSQDIADSINLGQLATEAVEGMRLFNTSSILGTEENNGITFADTFREKYGEPEANMSFAVLAYDAAGVLLQAIKEVGTEGEAIRDYLYELDAYNGASAPFYFDEKGDVIGIPYGLKEFKNGIPTEIDLLILN